MPARLLQFLKDRRGAAGTEFALVALIFFGATIGITDFSRALWVYNEAGKACQVGARFAVANDMVPANLAAWSGVIDASPPYNPGASIPESEFPDPFVCDDTGCSNPGGFNPGYDSVAYDAIVDRMTGYFNSLATDPNAVVTVTYEHIGLGFAGNPLGPDVSPLVTVDLSGMTFNFFTPLMNLASIEFPRCSASLTGEDYATCPAGGAPPC